MQRYTFTFGGGQECRCGRSVGGCYTHIDALGLLEARARMALLWSDNWCGSYASDDEAGVARFGLKLIVSNFDDPTRCPCGRGPMPNFTLAALECSECGCAAGAVVMPPDGPKRVSIRMMCEPCREQLRRAP
jgi:hypothetical protein